MCYGNKKVLDMGTNIFFFTDVDLLNEQTPEQAFGPVSNTISQFRVVNTFTVLDKANIYAICRGKKLTYQDGTVILYPYDETIVDGLPVQYFIYTNVDVSNVVTQLIPEDESDDLLIAQQYKYSEYLESVEAGAIIAETYDNTVSIAVVTTGVDDGLRAFEKYDDCVTINGGENSKRQREKILSYMDISAFYGMFVGDKIKVKKNTRGGTVYKSKEKIYNYILSKFWNRNKIYVDIRDSRYYSLNYRKNEETQHCIEVQGNISSNVEYETFPQWPLLIIEEPKDSNNADSLSLKYYEAIVQISNGRKTYCVFGYKRKGKRLIKQRLYNTTEISISFPVVNGNYVSSYYRYMVDTDITNQEGLNGLFQVRPFEEYTRYYNSSAKVQSWLTGRLCFYENDVVACGIALDKRNVEEIENNRINLFAVPIQENVTNINSNICNSCSNTFFSILSTEIQLLKIKTKLYNETGAVEEVSTLTYSSKNGIHFVCLSMTQQELKTITTFEEDEFSALTIETVGIPISNGNNTTQGEGMPLVPLLLRKYIIKCGSSSSQNIIKAYTYDFNRTLLSTTHATDLENIASKEVGIIYFQQSDESTYPNDCTGTERIELQKKELHEFEDALKDISIYNSRFYDNLMNLLYKGVPIYPNGKEEMYYPQIIVTYGYAKGLSGVFTVSESDYIEIGSRRSSEYIRLANREKSLENEIIQDYVTQVLNQCYEIDDNKTTSTNVEWLHIGENKNDSKEKAWLPKFQIDKNGWLEGREKDINKYGVAILKPELHIELSMNKRCNANGKGVKDDYLTSLNVEGYTERRFFVASTLIHELAHVYERVTHMEEDYLWASFVKILPLQENIQNQYPDYRNINSTGHILGRPSATLAIKEELTFEKTWHIKMKEKLEVVDKDNKKYLQKYITINGKKVDNQNYPQNVTYSNLLKTEIVVGVYTKEEYFIKDFYLNKNNLTYEKK